MTATLHSYTYNFKENIQSDVDKLEHSIVDYRLKTLSDKEFRMVMPIFKDEDWFTNKYQSKVEKSNPEYYTLGSLLSAVKNSEQKFQQYPTDERNIKVIAKSIFVESIWLQRDVTLAIFDNKRYVVGGRHRLAALANTFSGVIEWFFKGKGVAMSVKSEHFGLALNQNIRCDVLNLATLEDLLTLVKSDNESRPIRRAEHSHLVLQTLGGDCNSIEGIGKTILSHELTPKETVSLAAQSFVRRVDSRLKPQTRQLIGEKIARFVLFGSKGNSQKRKLLVQSVEEFNRKMNKAWELLLEYVQGQEIVARNASAISSSVIEKLEHYEAELTFIESEIVPIHHFGTDGQQQVTGVRKNVRKTRTSSVASAQT